MKIWKQKIWIRKEKSGIIKEGSLWSKCNIKVEANGKAYEIMWAIREDFSELKGKKFEIYKMSAKDILSMDLSDYSKILLSAMAGAVIQYLIDIDALSNGVFYID